MSRDTEFPELPNVPFSLQARAPQQQLHLGWGSNINFGSDPVNSSDTRALSAAGPLPVATSESPVHAAPVAVGSHSTAALGATRTTPFCRAALGDLKHGALNPTVSQPTALKAAEAAHTLISPR